MARRTVPHVARSSVNVAAWQGKRNKCGAEGGLECSQATFILGAQQITRRAWIHVRIHLDRTVPGSQLELILGFVFFPWL